MSPAGAPRRDGPESEPDGGSWLERALLQFVRESTLWPILVVLIAHAAAFLAPLLLFALRDRRLPALAALAVLAFGSGAVVRHELGERRRPGPLSGVLAATWLLSAGAAWLAHHYGIF